MLLYAHLERAHEDVPSILHSNLSFVIEKSIPLLQEMFKIACLPRRPYGRGWLVGFGILSTSGGIFCLDACTCDCSMHAMCDTGSSLVCQTYAIEQEGCQ